MPGEEELQEKIRQLDWDDLQDLYERVKNDDTEPEWNAGKAFEYLVLRAFELNQASVTYPYSVKLPVIDGSIVEQIDGAVHFEHLSCIVESKDYANPVNIEPISKLRNQLTRRPSATVGIVFSVKGFTNPAHVLAHFTQPETILLWTGDEVEFALGQRAFTDGLIAKYRHYVEHGLPDYNIESESIP